MTDFSVLGDGVSTNEGTGDCSGARQSVAVVKLIGIPTYGGVKPVLIPSWQESFEGSHGGT